MNEADFYTLVGERIRNCRRDLNQTQQELADAVGLTRSSIANVERGCQKILIHTLAEIATNLRVDIMELVPQNHNYSTLDNISIEELESSNYSDEEIAFVTKGLKDPK